MAINAIRMTGLSSGLDTESIISAMTQTYKSKVDYEKQSKQLMELKQEKWKEMNTKIYSFYTSTLNDFKFNTTYGKTTVSNTNEDAILIEEDANLPAGTHSVKVNELATAASVTTAKMAATTTASTTLNELNLTNGQTLTIDSGEGPVTITIEDVEVKTTDADGNEVTTTRPMTISDLQKQVNDNEKLDGMKFSFDANAKMFFINSKKTGASQSITLGGTADWSKLGVTADAYTGQNASYEYNGVAQESESNTININGLKATLVGKTTAPVTITAVKDTEKTMEVVKDFVDEYNKLLEEINTLVDAPSARDYRPLTDEQKETMSESDIKLWNEKVQKSILRKDTVLSSISTKMREIVGSSDLFQIGVSTAGWQEKGKLYINEQTLTEMIEGDPDKVDSILKEVGSDLYDNIGAKLKGGTDDKSSNFLFADKLLKKQIEDSGDRISVLEDRLVTQEDLYYAKFTAMEQMLSQLNSQSSWLTGQFSS